MIVALRRCRRTDALVEELSVPPDGSEPLFFPTRYPRNYVRPAQLLLPAAPCS